MLKTFALCPAVAVGGMSAGMIGAFYGIAAAGKAPQLIAEFTH